MVHLGLPINSMVIFHGELLDNQMVTSKQLECNPCKVELVRIPDRC